MKILSFLFSLLIINFFTWSSFHLPQHIIPDLFLDYEFGISYQEHLHSDDIVHKHKLTSSSDQKKHHQQSDIYFFLLNFNSEPKEYFFCPAKKINNFKKLKKHKTITKYFDKKNYFLISKNNTRDPPKLKL